METPAKNRALQAEIAARKAEKADKPAVSYLRELRGKKYRLADETHGRRFEAKYVLIGPD